MGSDQWAIVVEPTHAIVASKARMASSWAARTIGLLGHRALPEGEAVIFPHCRSIHTIGMRFPIDVIFVDRTWRVVALRSGLAPGRIVAPVWPAWGVVETACGVLQRIGLKIGDQLRASSCLTKQRRVG